ncbi:hypothetical protein EVAR_65212_1 [Eumeta japonica]|uniref:RNase H type-1 domain-containing protein n=1 Tax=Eumeta variegata TaxID=151549 RepID=A0A4C2A3F6_EUMVA|nr:hypothetical protein EVAR_65212_1 [Eumeta japonica]
MPGSPHSEHSALILSRLLPLDIRVSEAAWLYEVKRGKDLGDNFVDRELERPVYFGDLPHPAHVPEIGYESVEDLDFQTIDRLAVVGPHIYTDGSRIEGKVGAALTEWWDGGETWYSTFCTVFQAEMVTLQRAIRRLKNGKDGLVNIEVTGPRTYHPLAHKARRDISEIVAEGRAVCLFWVRAHAGIAGNERADELARRALTKKTAADYDKFPLSNDVANGANPYGHGGFTQYLHRFKLKDSPYCACDPAKIQDVLYVLEECPMLLRKRVALETEIGVIVGRREFPTIIEDDQNREDASDQSFITATNYLNTPVFCPSPVTYHHFARRLCTKRFVRPARCFIANAEWLTEKKDVQETSIFNMYGIQILRFRGGVFCVTDIFLRS